MTTIQLRIDKKTKESARKVFDKLGVDMSAAIKLYLNQVILTKSIPLSLKTENGFTREEEISILEASEEAKRGKNVDGPFEGEAAMGFLKKLIDQ